MYKMKFYLINAKERALFFLLSATTILPHYACNNTSATAETVPPPVILPVYEIKKLPATTYRDYSATMEGKVNVEIRPQVDGYIEKIFVDEGAHVRAGQR